MVIGATTNPWRGTGRTNPSWREPAERGAHRRAAQIEPAGELQLGHLLAGFQIPADDRLTDPSVGLIGQRLFGTG